MRKNSLRKTICAFMSALALGYLSIPVTVNAEDIIYYGAGDANNKGDISGVNWVLNKDYRFYGGHQYFYNAYTNSGNVSDNLFTINGGVYTVGGDSSFSSNKYSNYFYGGISLDGGNATNNGIIINNGNFVNESGTWQAAGIYAAQATGKGYVASNNYVTVNNGDFKGYTYISPGLGYSGADATNNIVAINGGSFEKGVYLFGARAYTTGKTDGNTVNVNGGTIGGYSAFIWGGKSDDGDSIRNTVNLTGGEVAYMPMSRALYENKFTEYEQGDAEFYGGYTLNGNALYNTVNIKNGSISTAGNGLAYGGYSRAGDANYNTVNVYGGNISSKMTIIGGFSAGANASGNTVNIRGGSGNGDVYLHGGITMNASGNANNNKVAVFVPARLKEISGGVYITGNDTDGYDYNVKNTGDLFTGNELYLASSGITAKNIYNFETLSFYLPSSYKSGDTMLALNGADNTDLTRSKVVLSVAGDTSLKKGQTVNLITSQGELNHSSQNEGTFKQGVSLNYNYTLEKDANNLRAVLKDAEVNGETKSFAATRAAQVAFLNRGADLLATDGYLQAEMAANTEDKNVKGIWSPFFSMQGGKYRYNIGSHIDSRGFNAILGVAREIKNKSGKLLFGIAGEYGKGSYDGYCENMHSKGDNDYLGAAVFVRQKNLGGTYYEGSLRAGRTKSDYNSKGFTGYEGTNIGYDLKSSYFGAHIGLGKDIKLKGNNKLDVSLKYFYSRAGGDTACITTGETYSFSAVNSHRVRLGARLTHTFQTENKCYFGAYYEREFNGDAKATVSGYNTAVPSLKGNSGIFEIGWLHQPKNSNFTLNLGVTATCGNQRGFTGNMGLMWKL